MTSRILKQQEGPGSGLHLSQGYDTLGGHWHCALLLTYLLLFTSQVISKCAKWALRQLILNLKKKKRISKG